jgi:hypothetical protein
VVTLNFTSWKQKRAWLRQIDGLLFELLGSWGEVGNRPRWPLASAVTAPAVGCSVSAHSAGTLNTATTCAQRSRAGSQLELISRAPLNLLCREGSHLDVLERRLLVARLRFRHSVQPLSWAENI